MGRATTPLLHLVPIDCILAVDSLSTGILPETGRLMSITNKPTDGPEQSLAEKAYLYLRRKILSGELPAGIPLSEASIARELGNSRTPLREAIRRLAAEGFLRHIPNRGSMVVEFSKRDIAELYELREALE